MLRPRPLKVSADARARHQLFGRWMVARCEAAEFSVARLTAKREIEHSIDGCVDLRFGRRFRFINQSQKLLRGRLLGCFELAVFLFEGG